MNIALAFRGSIENDLYMIYGYNFDVSLISCKSGETGFFGTNYSRNADHWGCRLR